MLEAKCSPKEKSLNSRWNPFLQDKREKKSRFQIGFPRILTALALSWLEKRFHEISLFQTKIRFMNKSQMRRLSH